MSRYYSLFLLVFGLFVLVGCGSAEVVSEPAANEVAAEPAAVEEAAVEEEAPEVVEEVEESEPTAIPTEEPTEEPTAEPTVVPTVEPTVEPTAEPTATAVPEPAAPETINLDEIQQGSDLFPNSMEMIVLQWDGALPDGTASSFGFEFVVLTQTEPEAATSMRMNTVTDDPERMSAMEAIVTGETYYFFSPDTGCFTMGADQADSSMTEGMVPSMELMGEATLVEEGVMVNGFVTDRYALTLDNFPAGGEMDPAEINMEEGSAYIAREGGFVTRLEMRGSQFPDASFGVLDPAVEAAVLGVFDYVPTAEMLAIVPPAGCAGQTAADFDVPQMADAYDVVTIDDQTLFYMSDAAYDEVLEFYEAELTAEGWTVTDAYTLGNLGQVTFEMDGEMLTVQVAENGDAAAVTVILGTAE